MPCGIFPGTYDRNNQNGDGKISCRYTFDKILHSGKTTRIAKKNVPWVPGTTFAFSKNWLELVWRCLKPAYRGRFEAIPTRGPQQKDWKIVNTSVTYDHDGSCKHQDLWVKLSSGLGVWHPHENPPCLTRHLANDAQRAPWGKLCGSPLLSSDVGSHAKARRGFPCSRARHLSLHCLHFVTSFCPWNAGHKACYCRNSRNRCCTCCGLFPLGKKTKSG